jgi:hypothetical protein
MANSSNTSNTDITKRQNPSHYDSLFQLGPDRINYGAVNPYDVMTKMWDACQEIACNPSPINYGVKLVINGGSVEWKNLVLHADGEYHGWDKRDAFMKVMLQMAQTQQSWNLRKWYRVDNHVEDWGQQWECDMYNYYSAQRWLIDQWGNEAYAGKMSLLVEQGGTWGSSCGYWQDGVQSVISAISGWAGAFFGLMKPFNC